MMQPHQLHHHLVGVGGAVKGAGARRVIARALALEQLGPARLAFGIELADLLLFLVGDPGGHRPAGHEHRRQMAKAQRADQQAGHDLVANAQQQRPVIHRMAQRHRGGERDHIAAEQRQLHPRLALGHPVAHRRGRARDLRGGAHLARPQLHLRGIAAIGLMRGEHVIIGGDDRQIGPALGLHRRLILQRPGIGMGKVGAGHLIAVGLAGRLALDQLEIGAARRLRLLDDPLRHPRNGGVEITHARHSCPSFMPVIHAT